MIGDWIFGTGSANVSFQNYLIFAMKVTEKLTFNGYWEDPRFNTKKPIMNGCSLKKMYGDNIYCHDGKEWHQADSHHSLKDGKVNTYNLKRDTSVDAVLVSDDFYYFGKSAIKIHSRYVDHIAKKGPGYRCPENIWGKRFIDFIRKRYRTGYYDDPIWFEKFKRSEEHTSELQSH